MYLYKPNYFYPTNHLIAGLTPGRDYPWDQNPNSAHFMAFSSEFEALGTGSGSVESGHARAVQLQLNSCVKYPFWSGCCREIRNNPQSPSIKLN